MKTLRRSVLIIVAAMAVLALSGCGETANKDESQVPWSRPASWEHQMPGLGGIGY